MLIITVALLFDYLWFTCNLLLLYGDIELNPGPNQNTAKKFLFATGTLIITFRSWSFLKRKTQFISLI